MQSLLSLRRRSTCMESAPRVSHDLMLCLQKPRRLLVNFHEQGIPGGMNLRKGKIGSSTCSESILSHMHAHRIDKGGTHTSFQHKGVQSSPLFFPSILFQDL